MGSRSDQLFNKRKARQKQEYKRKQATLSGRPRVLILCEGEKTEPQYFRSLIYSLRLTAAEVEVCGESGSAPISIVKFGMKRLNLDPDFDQIYFVFDKDSHASYRCALNLVFGLQKQKKYVSRLISPITSNPCFEVWYLMHFEPFCRPVVASGGKSPCENVIRILEKKPYFGRYRKDKRNLFESLSSRLEIAKQNSEQVLRQCESAGTSIYYGNPTTLVHRLVIALEELARNQNDGFIG